MALGSGQGRGDGPAGSIARLWGKDGPKVVRSRGHRWTDAAEAIFLDHLAATCNVTASAEAAGFSTVAIYRRRSRDAGFAGRWEVALTQGYAHLEMLAVRLATDALEGFEPDPSRPTPPVAFKEILNLLAQHRRTVAGDGGFPGRPARPRSLDEVRASIVVKLEAIETARLAEGGAPYPGRDGDGD